MRVEFVREWAKSNEFLDKYDKNNPPSGRGLFNYPFDGSGRRQGEAAVGVLTC